MQHQTSIEIKLFIGNKNFTETVTRVQLEQLDIDLFQSITNKLEKALEDGDVCKYDINEIVLIDSSTHSKNSAINSRIVWSRRIYENKS